MLGIKHQSDSKTITLIFSKHLLEIRHQIGTDHMLTAYSEAIKQLANKKD